MTACERLLQVKTGGRSEGEGGSEQILNESLLDVLVGVGWLKAGDQVKLITAGFLIVLYL